MKENLETDPVYREKRVTEETEIRMKIRARKQLNYKNKIAGVSPLSKKKRADAIKSQWKSLNSWRKGLVLREKCIWYFKQEIENITCQNRNCSKKLTTNP